MTLDPDRHAEMIREQVENLLGDLARVTGDPEGVTEYVEGIAERMRRELGDQFDYSEAGS